MFTIAITLIVFLITLLLVRGWQKGQYWQSKGVPVVSAVPFFGHFLKTLLGYRWENIDKIYYKTKSHGFCGLYSFLVPEILVNDPKILKDVFVKEAESFIDRRTVKVTKKDKYFGEMLTNLKGQDWKSLRALMTPTFTSGKIKAMYNLIEPNVDELMAACDKEMEEKSFVELASLYSYYTLDVIASCAFGLDGNCIKIKEDSPFVKNAKAFFKFDLRTILKFVFVTMFPRLAYLLDVGVLGDTDYMADVVERTVETRRKSGARRGDFLDLLLDALKEQELEKDENKYPMTIKTVISESLLFIFAGFDTVGNALAITTYLMAKETQAQKRLRDELEAIIEKDGEFTYQNVMDAQYLEAFSTEALRLYPPAHFLERNCTKPYLIPESDVEIPENMLVSIPVWSLHRDPEYWEDPLQFKPERFLPENKNKIVPYTYMPFGLGPRNCIAMRFAQMELKMVLAKLCYSYEIELRPGYKGLTLAKALNTLRPDDNGIQVVMKKIERY